MRSPPKNTSWTEAPGVWTGGAMAYTLATSSLFGTLPVLYVKVFRFPSFVSEPLPVNTVGSPVVGQPVLSPLRASTRKTALELFKPRPVATEVRDGAFGMVTVVLLAKGIWPQLKTPP